MAAPAEFPGFIHGPLPDSTTHIRLLEILQVDALHKIACSLSTWPLDDAPPYYAISYTWGSATDSIAITLNGQTMGVGQNCLDAITQAFARKTRQIRYIWIDAICIDQKTIRERNHQVRMMGDIYKKAEHVLACVGVHSNDSQFLVDFCRKKMHLLKDIFNFAHRIQSTQWSSGVYLYGSRMMRLRCLCGISPTTRFRLTEAFLAFVARSYFTRVWILQELYLGCKVSFCCGSNIMSAEQIAAVRHLVIPIHDNTLRDFRLDNQTANNMIRSISRVWGQPKIRLSNSDRDNTFEAFKPQLGCLGLATNQLRLKSLQSIMEIIQHFQCTDERDELYGILSMVQWPSGNVPTPDYQRDRIDIVLDLLKLIFEEPNRADLMHHTMYYDHAISWVALLVKIFGLLPVRLDRSAQLKRRCQHKGVKDEIDSSWHQKYDIRDPGWCARSITASPSTAAESHALYCKRWHTGLDEVALVDEYGSRCARAPTGTKAGDLYIQMLRGGKYLPFQGSGPPRTVKTPDGWDTTGIVLRPSGGDCYTIVGLAQGFHHFVGGKEITMQWDIRDLLLTYLAVPDPRDVSFETLSAIVICGSKDSSIAVVSDHIPLRSRAYQP